MNLLSVLVYYNSLAWIEKISSSVCIDEKFFKIKNGHFRNQNVQLMMVIYNLPLPFEVYTGSLEKLLTRAINVGAKGPFWRESYQTKDLIGHESWIKWSFHPVKKNTWYNARHSHLEFTQNILLEMLAKLGINLIFIFLVHTYASESKHMS